MLFLVLVNIYFLIKVKSSRIMLPKIDIKYYRWLRNTFIGIVISAPIIGYWYTNEKMVNMEKGIHDDLRRIQVKGKTLADIPRK